MRRAHNRVVGSLFGEVEVTVDENVIAERLAVLETKIDMLLEDRGRLASVEKRQWLHSGAVAVLAFIFSKFGIPLPH